MSTAPLPFPGPKTVAGWWTRFAPDATALVAGTVAFTRVEVGVTGTEPAPPDPLVAAVLRALAVTGPATAADLDRRLHVGPARVEAALRDAADRGLTDPPVRSVYSPGPGTPPTDVGRSQRVVKRIRLAFRDGQFLPAPDTGPFAVGTGGPSEVHPIREWVVAAAGRPAAWKRDANFPDIAPDAVAAPEIGWRGVPLFRPDALTAVVTRTTADGVAVFPAAGPDWHLAGDPLFTLAGEPAAAAFPELFAAPPDADLRAAWQGWAKSRSVPADDLAACRLALSGAKLEVHAPGVLAAWLRANRADVFRGDTWVWVGDGPLRRAAVLVVW